MTLERSRSWLSGMWVQRLSAALTLVVVLLLGPGAVPAASPQTFTVLYDFTGGADGAYIYDTLLRVEKTGTLYGTAGGDGHSKCLCGVVFKLDASGTLTVLHTFTGRKDGDRPVAGLIRDEAGTLYGTTYAGGNGKCGGGCGVVFKLDTAGRETVLHNFAGGFDDGNRPYGGLIRDDEGNLYGVTTQGGNHECSGGCGVVYKIDVRGKETLLHKFDGTDGTYPVRRLIRDQKGNLYGITVDGGIGCTGHGCGTVYKLSARGKLTVLHNFTGSTTDGCEPLGSPYMDADGNIFGTTGGCGSFGYGTVWKISKSGIETVLHNFSGGTKDGQYPQSGLIPDSEGNFYGVTAPSSSNGTVYKLSKSGALTVLHVFTGSDGAQPMSGLVRDDDGTLFGGTQFGGDLNLCSGYGCGVVFKLTP